MALPSNLETLDYAWMGQPFYYTIGKSAIDTLTMDYALAGQPFVAPNASTAPTGHGRLLGFQRTRLVRYED